MPYIRQDEVKPITAKAYLLENWQKYDLVDPKEDFIALLNILQACGESIDSLHNVVFNGIEEFIDCINSHGGWETDRDLVDTLFYFCRFFTEQEFIDYILDRREDYATQEEYVEAIRREASDADEDFADTQITRTDDGYVRRIWV